MFRNMIWLSFFGLILGGCASDRMVDSPSGTSSTADRGAAVSAPTTSSNVVAESSSTIDQPTTRSMNQSKPIQNRLATEVGEETLDSCVARIPQDATTGQRMLAEQTCQRNFAPGR